MPGSPSIRTLWFDPRKLRYLFGGSRELVVLADPIHAPSTDSPSMVDNVKCVI